MKERARDDRTRFRRMMLDIARRKQRAGSGSFGLRPDGVYRLHWPDLNAVFGDAIPWAVAGGVATRRYMPERATQDIDVVVLAQDERRAEDLLRKAQYRSEGPLRIGGSGWRSLEGTALDLIPLNEPWAEQALAEASRNRGADGMPVFTLAFLVIMKLLAARPTDTSDISRMMAAASDEDRQLVREAARRWAPDDVEDLESMIWSGRREAGEL